MRLESHFVEMHSAASRKTHPASLSCVPDQTTAVLPSPGSSPPSETSVSSPDRSRRLPSVATPGGVGLVPSAPDTADRSPAPCSRPSQTAAPLVVPVRSHRLAPTASSKRLLKGALLGSSATFSALIPQSGQRTR